MRRSPHPAVVLLAVLLSTLALPITLTGAAVALPDIGSELRGSLASVQWVVNGYNATFASFMLAAGALADRFGRRRVFATGVAIFTGSGLLGAVAGNILLLDLARVVAGIGAAAAATSASAILADTFEGRARTRAFALFGTVIGVGLAFGPSIAGLLIEGFGWRAVFGGPVLIGCVVLALVPLLPESRAARIGPMDWAGNAAFTGALLLLIFGFVEGPELGWAEPMVLAAFTGVVVLLVVFVLVERRVPAPMFDLGLMASPRFLGYLLAAGAIVTIFVPLLIYLPSYLTTVLGLNVGSATRTLISLTAPTVVLPLLGAMITKRIPAGAVVVGAVVVIGFGAAWLTGIGPNSTPSGLVAPLLTIGVGIGLSIGLLDGLAISSVAPARAGIAAGMINTARLASETVAIAVVGSVLATSTGGRLAEPGFTGGLRTVLWSMAGFAGVAALSTALLLRRGPARRSRPPVAGSLTTVNRPDFSGHRTA